MQVVVLILKFTFKSVFMTKNFTFKFYIIDFNSLLST